MKKIGEDHERVPKRVRKKVIELFS